MNKLVLYIFLGLFLFGLGCFTNELIHSSKEMKQEKSSEEIKQQILEYRPIVVANNSTIKLGEVYLADVRLAIVNTNNPPIVIIGKIDSLNFNLSGDTLKYDPQSQASIFREKPTTLGKHIWEGKIIDIDNRPHFFHMEYTVTQ